MKICRGISVPENNNKRRVTITFVYVHKTQVIGGTLALSSLKQNSKTSLRMWPHCMSSTSEMPPTSARTLQSLHASWDSSVLLQTPPEATGEQVFSQSCKYLFYSSLSKSYSKQNIQVKQCRLNSWSTDKLPVHQLSHVSADSQQWTDQAPHGPDVH